MVEWVDAKVKLPPENIVVETKIDDGKGCRNQTKLIRKGNLWFIHNEAIYVYYMPTHWRFIQNE